MPTLNAILNQLNQPPVQFPVCVHYNFEVGSEILIMKDLRLKGFRMVDKKKGMDFDHSIILIKELARLHASSVIHRYALKEQNKTILEKYPFLENKWLDHGSTAFKLFESALNSGVTISLAIIRRLDEYKEQALWLETHKTQLMDIYLQLIKSSPENMRVINHGDCWNNNVVFKYDDRGHPIEVTLLDLQVCRFGSIGLDFNYLLYTSLTKDVRNKYFEHFISEYYSEFENVIKSSKNNMSFTRAELEKEILDRTLFGILSGIMTLPFIEGGKCSRFE
ncbi:UNVERIFIED_CONTAM: hypothetical protein GTU68_033749 [Idotea baltica]|nr:hypothetical protein [Idotea baltica]